MKTTGFGSLEVSVLTGGNVMVTAFSPEMGHFEIPMSADELMLFLVESGNILADARKEEGLAKQGLELEREMKR